MADLFHKSAIDVVTGFARIRDELPVGSGIVGAGFVINRDLRRLLNGVNPSQPWLERRDRPVAGFDFPVARARGRNGNGPRCVAHLISTPQGRVGLWLPPRGKTNLQ